MARGSDTRQCYVYFGEVDGVVRYVGQGRKGRIGRHLREMRRPENLRRRLYVNLIAAVELGADIKFYKVAENLSSEESQQLEREEIAKYPREQLWNTMPGRRPKVADKEIIKKMSATYKAQWADPAYRERMKAALSSPESRAKIAKAVTEHMTNPARREKVAAARRADWTDLVYREKMVAAVRRRRKPWSPEHIEKKAAIHRDPEYLARLSAAHKKAK